MSYKSTYIRASEVRKAARDLEGFGEIGIADVEAVQDGLRGRTGRIYPYTLLSGTVKPAILRSVITYAAHCHAENTQAGCPGCQHDTDAAGMVDQDGNTF